MFQEFKKFALRGNVVDLAVGVIIGGAFGKIVSSLVNDILMPPLGAIIGNVDFSDLKIVLRTPIPGMKPATINYGLFINQVIDFAIVALTIFLVVKSINKLTEKATKPVDPTTKECPQCLSTIPVKATRCAFCTSAI